MYPAHFLLTCLLAASLQAGETVPDVAVLGVTPSKDIAVLRLEEQQGLAAQLANGSYSLAPTVQDSGSAYYMSDADGPTLHTFDGVGESGGANLFGTTRGSFLVFEGSEDLGNDADRVIVEVWAVDGSGVAEPWVDSSNAGSGLTHWRLDLGSNFGGNSQIQPGVPFTVLGSGVAIFDSAGGQLATDDLSLDSSTASGLSGVAIFWLGGADIAGFDLAGMQMYWDIQYPPVIEVRPQSLSFTQPPELALSAGQSADAGAERRAATQDGLPALLDKAASTGEVRVIVGFDAPFQPEGRISAASRQAQRQAIQSRGNQLLAGLQGRGFRENRRYRQIPYMALTVSADALQHLAKSPLVTSIEEDRPAKPTLASSTSVIGAPLAWAEGYDGSGQAIAVLDTGVDKTHPWFTTGGSKVVSEACYSTTSQAQKTTSFCPGGVADSTAAGSGLNCHPSIDGCDHGTHVAGIAAGNAGAGPDFGAARGADVIAMQVFSQKDDPAYCWPQSNPCVTTFSADLIAAMERVLELKDSFAIAAVNMSLGGGRYFNQATCDASNGATKAAVDNLRSFGIATVVASGNDGWKDSISWPGCLSSAVSVGATTDADAIASFSNIYPQLHLLAPGVNIVSSVPGGGVASFNGTSMATPLVAGAWAVLKQAAPAAGVDTILAALQSTATPVDDLRPAGGELDLPRINLDLALGNARTTFGIFNEGGGTLSVSSITPASAAPWIGISPVAPFDVPPGGLQVVEVTIDYDLAPPGESQVRLLIGSNDPDANPWPNGVDIIVTTLVPDMIVRDGFEALQAK
jgi:hypothetical protein